MLVIYTNMKILECLMEHLKLWSTRQVLLWSNLLKINLRCNATHTYIHMVEWWSNKLNVQQREYPIRDNIIYVNAHKYH